MKDLLKDLVDQAQGFVELRYHKRTSNQFAAQKGRVDVANHSITQGIGVRALVDGAWGFAATADLSKQSIQKAIEEAQKNAQSLASLRGKRIITLDRDRLARLDFHGEGFDELQQIPLADKLSQVVDYEKKMNEASSKLSLASCRFSEIFEEKVIVTSDGALASLKIAQPEFRIGAIAESGGERTSAGAAAGVSGGWNCLFNHPSLEGMIEKSAKEAVDLLSAPYPEGGHKTVILEPAVVGLLCHEAIGHTVEADFVKAGSVAQGKIGQRVGSDLVNISDTGCEDISGYAVGNLPFDDEGVLTENTDIIENGILKSFLHNRESANEFDVAPTGNARAWIYNDEPLIRMRNTYMKPGKSALSDMIAEVDDGYLIEGGGSGQADANGEFMFGCSHVWEIKNGKKKRFMREATVSGIAFDVLKTVDAVSSEFRWDLGTGYCGKGQPAKVDAGGPYIRCKINIGGQQA